MPAQPTTRDPAILKLLTDNIANLKHPRGWIKHPYFQEQFSGNPEGIRELKTMFCEAIYDLLAENDKLKKPVGRPRKDADS